MIFLYIFANFFLFKTFKIAEGSIVSLILITSSIWTIIFSMIFIGETLNLLGFLGIALIILALGILNRKGLSDFKSLGKGEIYAIIAALFFGIALGNDFYIIGDKPIYMYAALSFFLPGIGTIALFYKEAPKAKQFLNPKNFQFLLGLSTFYGISLASTFEAYQRGGEAIFISPITQLSIFIIIGLSWVFLGEKTALKDKLIAGIIAIIGVILISI